MENERNLSNQVLTYCEIWEDLHSVIRGYVLLNPRPRGFRIRHPLPLDSVSRFRFRTIGLAVTAFYMRHPRLLAQALGSPPAGPLLLNRPTQCLNTNQKLSGVGFSLPPTRCSIRPRNSRRLWGRLRFRRGFPPAHSWQGLPAIRASLETVLQSATASLEH